MSELFTTAEMVQSYVRIATEVQHSPTQVQYDARRTYDEPPSYYLKAAFSGTATPSRSYTGRSWRQVQTAMQSFAPHLPLSPPYRGGRPRTRQ